MSTVTLFQESEHQGGFYVPQFEVKIEGVGLPRDVLRDVVQCTYKDNIEQIDSFELTVNNWDAAQQTLKYVGAETEKTLRAGDLESHVHRLFEPCSKEVQILMGYSGDLRRMLTGTFTTMEPSFPSSGASTLSVRGLNVLHQLRRRQYTTTWRNKKYSEIAEDISSRRDARGGRRFPLPIVTDDQAKDKEPEIPYLAQRNQYDLDFLLARARECGYVLTVCEGKEEDRRLYFGPSQQAPCRRDVTFELKWGASLIDFKPTLTTANQIKSVTVRGWNRRNGRRISETVSLDDRRSLRRCGLPNRDLHRLLLERCDPREEVTVDEPVFTAQQARERACAILQDRQKEMIKASGTTVGLPDLRAGNKIQITNIGARFSGTYFVTETTHSISDSGYTTRFKARREDEEAEGNSQ
jgi:phage protein D